MDIFQNEKLSINIIRKEKRNILNRSFNSWNYYFEEYLKPLF